MFSYYNSRNTGGKVDTAIIFENITGSLVMGWMGSDIRILSIQMVKTDIFDIPSYIDVDDGDLIDEQRCSPGA